MDLSIVIVTYNSRAPVERCIASIEAHEPRCSYETIVVDNASSDGTADAVSRRFPRVRVAANDENLGYSRGVNQGIRLSSGRAILILNPDIVVRDGSIDRLMEFMGSHPDAGIVGSRLEYPDGRLQHSCRSFYTVPALILRRTVLGKLFPNARPLRAHLLLDYDHETVRAVDWIIGACMLVRREALERVGSMDERFFLYFEDIDWCNRMKRHGWSVYYVPASVMTHTYERSSAKSVLRKPFLIHLLSLLRYYEKWNRFFYAVRRNRGAIKASVLAVSDLAAVNLSFLAAYHLRNIIQQLFVNSLYPIGWYGSFILFSNLVFLIAFVAAGLYRVRRETPFAEEFMRVARAVFIWLVVLMAATYISRVRIYSRAVVLGQAGIAVFAVSLFRRVIRETHRELVRARFDLKHVLIVGSRDEAIELAERLAGASELGIDVVGRVGDGPGALGAPGDLPELLERFKIQEVLICPSSQSDRAILPFLAHSRRRVIQIRMISPLARLLGPGARVEDFAGIAAFSLDRRILLIFERVCKRLIDIAAGAIALPFVFCVFLAYRWYGRMTGAAAFSVEARRGRGGRAVAWPRVVRPSGREAGDFVKPALCIALIGGGLSLVGPPLLAEGRAGEYVGVLDRMRPGITGRWRLSRRGSAREALEEEALGLESWSLGRDFMIFMESIGTMCSGTYPRWFFSKGDAP